MSGAETARTQRTITLERRRKSRRKTKAASRDIREPAHADYVMFVMDEVAAVPGAAWRLLASDNQRLFKEGFAAYADGVPHDRVPAYLLIEERSWWLKGWYASRNANEGINGNR